jgi:hypothetical protein
MILKYFFPIFPNFLNLSKSLKVVQKMAHMAPISVKALV